MKVGTLSVQVVRMLHPSVTRLFPTLLDHPEASQRNRGTLRSGERNVSFEKKVDVDVERMSSPSIQPDMAVNRGLQKRSMNPI